MWYHGALLFDAVHIIVQYTCMYTFIPHVVTYMRHVQLTGGEVFFQVLSLLTAEHEKQYPFTFNSSTYMYSSTYIFTCMYIHVQS